MAMPNVRKKEPAMNRTFDPNDDPGELAASRENPGRPMGIEPQVLFVGGRELRTIPKAWLHSVGGGTPRPLLPDEMPDVAGLAPEETEIVVYETVSEGTPISPPFPNTREGRMRLVAYCAGHCTTWGDHKGGAEAWAALLVGEHTAVTADGVVIAEDR